MVCLDLEEMVVQVNFYHVGKIMDGVKTVSFEKFLAWVLPAGCRD